MLRVSYFILALVLCFGIALLGLWPWAIKPRLHEIITNELQAFGAEHGLLVRAGEFNITGLSEIELVSARVEDLKKHWSVQAPLVTLEISPLSLFFGTQPLRKVSVTSPTILGAIVETGLSKPKFNFPSGLAEVTIQDGFIQLEHPAQNAAFRLSNVNATLKRRASQIQIVLNLGSTWLQMGDRSLDITDLQFVGSLKDAGAIKDINIRTAELNAQGISLSAFGHIAIDEHFALRQGTQIHFATRADLKALASQQKIAIPLTGTFLANGEIHLGGKDHFVASGKLGAKDLDIDDIRLGLVDAGFSFENDIIAISELEALFGGTIVRADAQIEPKKNWYIGLTANFKNLSLYDMLTDIGVKSVFVEMGLDGRVDATGHLWPVFGLTGQASATGKSFIVADRKARNAHPRDIILSLKNTVSIQSRIAVDADSFRFVDATVSDKASLAKTDCTLYFDKKKGIKAKVDSDNIDFVSINNKIGDETYRGSGRVSTTLIGPYEDIRIDGSASLRQFALESLELGLVTTNIQYHGDDLLFKQANVESEDIRATGELGINFAQDVYIDLKIPTVSAKLPQAFNKVDYLGFAVLGEVNGSFELRGPASLSRTKQWQGALKIQSNDAVAIEGITLDAFKFMARSTKEEWIIDDAEGHLSEGKAQVSGTIRKKDLRAQVTAKLDQIPLFDTPDAEGTLNAKLALSGDLNDPRIAGTIQIEDLKTDLFSLGSQDIRFASADDGRIVLSGDLFSNKASLRGELVAELAKRRVKVDQVQITTQESDSLIINGYIDAADSKLNLLAGMNLDNFKMANDKIDSVRGRLEADIQLLGNIFDPSLSGKAQLKNGQILLTGFATPIDNIAASFSLTGKEVLIQSLSGKCGQGFFEGHARTLFSGYSPQEVDAHALVKSFPLPSSTFLLGTASGYLDFRKLDSDVFVAGDLRIADAYIASELRLEDLKFNSNTNVGSHPVRLDLRVRTESPVRLDTDFIVGEMDANLHVVGTHLSPGLVGYLELKGAAANFRNNEYQLQRARIDFDDTFKIVPRLDILAVGQVDNYRVETRLIGTPERPQLHLTSDPFLPETQLLTLMSLGYVAGDIKELGTTARNTGIEALSAYFGVGQNLIRFINRPGSSDFLRLEDLSLSSIFSKTDGVSLPALRLGMNVGSGIKLRLHSTLVDNDAGKREQRVELEQSLGRQMKWRLGWDSDGLSNFGDAGIDLWYRWEID